jgi:DNA-directed RNA polymerase specialized sigma24 family protein
MEPHAEDVAPSNLDRISTRWPAVGDPVQFVLRYAPAIRKYLDALLRDTHDADEVEQEFLARVVERGFANADPGRGRFRDYLKTAVRNAALNYLRGKRRAPQADVGELQLAGPEGEQAWVAGWQRCALDKAWRGLDQHQARTPGNLFHTVLRLSVDHPDEDSEALAARAAALAGRPLRADAFRKQLSRARRLFAELLLQEVTGTLEDPTPHQVEEELIDLGLMPYIADFLPDDWRRTVSGV